MKIKRGNNETEVPNWLLALGVYVVSDLIIKVVEIFKKSDR